jgi:hypothetical protein
MKATTWLTVACVVLILAFMGCSGDPRNSYESRSDYKKLAEKAKDLERTSEHLAGALEVIKLPPSDDYTAQKRRESCCDLYLEFVRDYNRDAQEYGFGIHRTRFDKAENVPDGEKALPSGFPRFDPMPKELVKK